jgi:hypothetical protein
MLSNPSFSCEIKDARGLIIVWWRPMMGPSHGLLSCIASSRFLDGRACSRSLRLSWTAHLLVLEAKIICNTNKDTQLAFRSTFFSPFAPFHCHGQLSSRIQLCIVISSALLYGEFRSNKMVPLRLVDQILHWVLRHVAMIHHDSFVSLVYHVHPFIWILFTSPV